MKQKIRINESQLRQIVSESVKRVLNEKVNVGILKDDLETYFKCDMSYDGSVGAANARARALSSVHGSLPWGINQYKFDMMLLYTPSDLSIGEKVERCIDWVMANEKKSSSPSIY